MRWDVEVKPDQFHDVGADRVEVGPGGTLLFWLDDRLSLAYAAGQWLTCSDSGAGS